MGRCSIIIALLYDSSSKDVFIRHSRFPNLNLPRIYLENLGETLLRGRNRVADLTD